jgi:hypothetical protein
VTELLEPQHQDRDLTASALDEIATGAARRDDAPVPAFPEEAIAALQHAGLMAWGTTGGRRARPRPRN